MSYVFDASTTAQPTPKDELYSNYTPSDQKGTVAAILKQKIPNLEYSLYF